MPEARVATRLSSSPPWHMAALLVALVIIRSLVWVVWEQSHFDADQAVIGLMGKHIAEGRAFPIFMYGQTYMLTVESWLAAPLFALFGASVPLLKLPILGMNIVVALVLFRALTHGGVAPIHAWLASLFFAIAPPITASRLVEAAGGNIEPFVYAVALWMLRDRPGWFGLVAAVGVTHREFVWYAVAAVVFLEGWTRVLWTRARLLHWRTSAVTMGAVVFVVRGLAAFDPVLGPGTEGLSTPGLMGGPAGRLCVDPSAAPSNVDWLLTRNLPALFGWRPEPLRVYNLNSDLTAGHWWVAGPVGVIALMAIGVLIVRLLRKDVAGVAARPGPGVPTTMFPAFLVLVGLQSALVYALASCGVQRETYIRYSLLTVLLAVGATAWLLTSVRSRSARRVAIGAVALWAMASSWDTGQLLAEYVRRRPPSPVRQLIAHLDRQGLRLGHAPYWTAYVVTFMSGERIILGSTDVVRINEYQDRVHSAKTPVIFVRPTPCEPTAPAATRLEGWCIEWD